MTKLYTLTASLMISTCLAGNALAQESSALDAEIAAIESQISEADGTIARYDGGLIRILAESRREALLLLRTVIETRKMAEMVDYNFCVKSQCFPTFPEGATLWNASNWGYTQGSPRPVSVRFLSFGRKPRGRVVASEKSCAGQLW